MMMSLRKVFILLLFCYTQLVVAQNISVSSFKLLENDLTANITGTMERDFNGETAALIKIVTTEQGFVFDGGMVGVVKIKQDVGEVWVYVPHGIKKITMKHPTLGVLRDYWLPIPIEKARTYEMVLSVGNVGLTEESVNVNENIDSELAVTTNVPIPKDKTTDDGNVTLAEEENRTYTVNGVSFTMIAVKGGSFMMGSLENGAFRDEKHVHQVTLSDYFIGETEVTQELWQAVMGYNPSFFTESQLQPLENVNWNDCRYFIATLNELTGEDFRLPTEAEWEFAARGGNVSKGYTYSGSSTLNDVAWHSGNSSKRPHPVKEKIPNELGIYDLSGNVSEWCADRYGRRYPSTAVTDPTGPSLGSYYVLRGGNWYSSPKNCSVIYRDYNGQGVWSSGYGFRLAK